jgi:hypothetical protein
MPEGLWLSLSPLSIPLSLSLDTISLLTFDCVKDQIDLSLTFVSARFAVRSVVIFGSVLTTDAPSSRFEENNDP